MGDAVKHCASTVLEQHCLAQDCYLASLYVMHIDLYRQHVCCTMYSAITFDQPK